MNLWTWSYKRRSGSKTWLNKSKPTWLKIGIHFFLLITFIFMSKDSVTKYLQKKTILTRYLSLYRPLCFSVYLYVSTYLQGLFFNYPSLSLSLALSWLSHWLTLFYFFCLSLSIKIFLEEGYFTTMFLFKSISLFYFLKFSVFVYVLFFLSVTMYH